MHWRAFIAYVAMMFCVTLGDDEPVLENNEMHIRTKEGSSAILACTVANMQPSYRVKWYSPDGYLISVNEKVYTSDRRVSLLQPMPSTWSIRIQGARQRDSGLYRCVLDTKPEQTKNVRLHVQVPPRISASEDTAVGVGKRLEISCNVTGEPTPEVKWYKDKKLLPEHTSEHLVIEPVRMRDKGVYECYADNGVTPSALAYITVDIMFPPNVSSLSHRIGQFVNRQTLIYCKVVANPEATITWYHDATPLKQTWKYRMENFSQDGETTHSLLITTVQKFDFGDYICFASNSEGSSSSATHLYEMYEITQRMTSTAPTASTTASARTTTVLTSTTASATTTIHSTPKPPKTTSIDKGSNSDSTTPSKSVSTDPPISRIHYNLITTITSEQVPGKSNSASTTTYRCPHIVLAVALQWIALKHS